MIRIILGLAAIVIGVWLFHAGWSRKESIMGSLAEAGTSLANTFDGKSRTPKHYAYLATGSLLVAGGTVVIVLSRKKS